MASTSRTTCRRSSARTYPEPKAHGTARTPKRRGLNAPRLEGFAMEYGYKTPEGEQNFERPSFAQGSTAAGPNAQSVATPRSVRRMLKVRNSDDAAAIPPQRLRCDGIGTGEASRTHTEAPPACWIRVRGPAANAISTETHPGWNTGSTVKAEGSSPWGSGCRPRRRSLRRRS